MAQKRTGYRQRTVALAIGRGYHTESDGGVFAAIYEHAQRHNWQLIDLEQWQLRIPASLAVDGLITCSTNINTSEIKILHAHVANSVCIDPDFDIPKGLIVRPDLAQLGQRAAKYFLERGFESLAVCSFFRTAADERLRSFRAYLQGRRIDCDQLYIQQQQPDTLRDQEVFFKKQMMTKHLPLALFCLNDRLATRVCRWCLELGLAVPEQVSILGAGNNKVACACGPIPISSVDPGNKAAGERAATLLQKMMDGKSRLTGPILAPVGQIVTRRSTDVMAVNNSTVARALRFIWDHYTADIGLRDVAEATDASIRSLTRNFRSELGHSVNQEISRRRIQHAKAMLGSSTAQVTEVALRSGFRSAQAFSRKFRDYVGKSPQDYRAEQRNRP